MSESSLLSRRGLVTTVLLLFLATCWGSTAWLAHDLRPWVIRWSDYCFILCWIASYLIGWGIAFAWTRGSQRRMAFRAVGTSGLVTILLGLLELPAFLSLVDYGEIFSMVTGEWNGPTTSFVSDLELGFRRPPNQRWTGRPRSDMAMAFNLPIRSSRPHTFTTDSHGFRNRNDRDSAPVALIGDSYIEGAYVSDDETCAFVLEELIGEPVANLGRSGYGTLQEKWVLEHYALPLRPRMIALFFFEGNDLYNDEDFENMVEYFRAHGISKQRSVKRNWEEFTQASLTANLFRWLRRVADPVVPINVATFGSFRDEQGQRIRLYFYNDVSYAFDTYERNRFEVTKVAFRECQRECREDGVRLIVLYVPSKFRVYGDYTEFPPESLCLDWKPWDLPALFQEFCVQEGIELLDLTGPMRAAAARGKVLYAPEDSHWSAEGHGFVAELLRREWERTAASLP